PTAGLADLTAGPIHSRIFHPQKTLDIVIDLIGVANIAACSEEDPHLVAIIECPGWCSRHWSHFNRSQYWISERIDHFSRYTISPAGNAPTCRLARGCCTAHGQAIHLPSPWKRPIVECLPGIQDVCPEIEILIRRNQWTNECRKDSNRHAGDVGITRPRSDSQIDCVESGRLAGRGRKIRLIAV